jgi:hypothetical protein
MYRHTADSKAGGRSWAQRDEPTLAGISLSLTNLANMSLLSVQREAELLRKGGESGRATREADHLK